MMVYGYLITNSRSLPGYARLGLCNQLQATHSGASRSIHGSVLLAQSPPHRLHSDSHEVHLRAAGLRASFSGPQFRRS